MIADRVQKTYEYPYIGNDKHQVAYRCSNPNCDDPFTLVGTYDCTYEWVEYENRIHGQFRGFKCVLFADILKIKNKINATSRDVAFLIADKNHNCFIYNLIYALMYKNTIKIFLHTINKFAERTLFFV